MAWNAGNLWGGVVRLVGWILATFLAPNFDGSFLVDGKWDPFRDGWWCWWFRYPAVVTSWGTGSLYHYLRRVLAPSQVAFFAGFLNHHQYFRKSRWRWNIIICPDGSIKSNIKVQLTKILEKSELLRFFINLLLCFFRLKTNVTTEKGASWEDVSKHTAGVMKWDLFWDQPKQMYGDFEGFPSIFGALFGLVR